MCDRSKPRGHEPSTVIRPYTGSTLIMRTDVIRISRSSISLPPSMISPVQRTEIDVNMVVLTEFSIPNS
ncbi:hypothetical protein PAXRUDRAFT_827532 [Paxillus rubicundulus Ve08.2h10]|uniref:Unplaced genomic scaffold scaffold_254, whole genome shotgun sequence n=1 Tax=Paxillus rubicundulus Ve08.2h10 TaxID=930991 RepID=A0A0D0E8G4_9AGAM|nr:hypothetical protein PAXRUDRAFT_827532 [Paxillus rubicundulus Ve08.2h10]